MLKYSWSKKKKKSKLVPGNFPDGARVLFSDSSAMCMHILWPEKSLFHLLLTEPSTILVLFSCPMQKGESRRVLAVRTWASAYCPLKQPMVWVFNESMLRLCQRQSFPFKWRMLRPQVILSSQNCWSDWLILWPTRIYTMTLMFLVTLSLYISVRGRKKP